VVVVYNMMMMRPVVVVGAHDSMVVLRRWRAMLLLLLHLHHVVATLVLVHMFSFPLPLAFSLSIPLAITVPVPIAIPVALPLVSLPLPHHAIPFPVIVVRPWSLSARPHHRHPHANHPPLLLIYLPLADNARLVARPPFGGLYPSPTNSRRRARRALGAPCRRPKHAIPHLERLLLLRCSWVPVVPMERRRPVLVVVRWPKVRRWKARLHLLLLLLELLLLLLLLLRGHCVRRGRRTSERGLVHGLTGLLLLLLGRGRHSHSHAHTRRHALRLLLLLHAGTPALDLLLLGGWREDVVRGRRRMLVL
jgi:hypothetical protein